MNVLFFDPKFPKPYDSEVLSARGLGGTEASVIRVARALFQMPQGYQVTVVQHNRTEVRQESATLRFAPMSELALATAAAAHVVFIQKAQALSEVARITQGSDGRFDIAKIAAVWSHFFADPDQYRRAFELERS